MGCIHLLDRSVCEQIAAGEVIEKPASVIKELVENSIDAGATSITVEIKKGGKTYMRVTDNGCGIAQDDMISAFLRHATSKIKEARDLNSVFTLGFRGEALASICAVSRVETMSKCRNNEVGYRYVVEGGERVELEECGCPDGTTIVVRELFYNVPARLKFLGKDVTEGNAVANIVTKLALSHPEISFKFIRDNRNEMITSGDGQIMSAVYSVLGGAFYNTVLPVEYSLNGVSVRGCVTKPLQSKANRAFQYFFVNNRSVRSQIFTAAIEEAYRNIIMVGKFPGCVLMISVDPATTDVNTHPTKAEIRFSDPKPIFDAIYFGVKNTLMTSDSTPDAIADMVIRPKKVLTEEEIFAQPEKPAEQLSFASPPVTLASEPKKPAAIKRFPGDSNIFNFFDEEPQERTVTAADTGKKIAFKYVNKFDPLDEAPSELKENAEIAPKREEEEIHAIGEVFKTYIVAQRGEDMYLIDKHAAHERFNFDTLKSGEARVEMQTLLSPATVSLSHRGHAAIAEQLKIFDRFGFEIKMLKAPLISVTGIPMLLTEDDPLDVLVELSERLADSGYCDFESIFDELYHSVACKASIKGNIQSATEELDYLAKLVIEKNIRYCPHGRPVAAKFSKYELDKLFKRVI